MKPLYIFDLDGTLALIDHRRHFVEGPDKDWRSFFAACVDDAPNMPVIRTLQALRKSGAEVWIWSGRSDEDRMSKGKISAGGLQLPAGTPIAGLAESVVIVTADTTLTSLPACSRRLCAAAADSSTRAAFCWVI